MIASNFDYESSAIIRPPSAESREVRAHTLVIDSRDRDRTLYPDAASYTIDLNETLCDVVSAELVRAWLPLSKDNVRPGCDAFWIDAQEVRLPHGRYATTAELAAAANAAMSALGLGASFALDAATGKLSLAAATPFVATFGDTAALFGFRSGKLACAGPAPLAASSPPDLEASVNGNYALMYIDGFHNLKSNNGATDCSFALIDAQALARPSPQGPLAARSFYPPLPDLRQLRVRFVDYEGRPYRFAGPDHVFQLRLECLKNGRRFAFG